MKFLATLMLCSMLVGSPAAADDPPVAEHQDDSPKPTEQALSVRIEAPEKVTIGELAEAKLIISGEARDIDWRFDPPLSGKVFNTAKTRCYFATGSKEQVYTIDVAVAGKTAGIARQTAKVEMAYAEGVGAKSVKAARLTTSSSGDIGRDIRTWANEVQTVSRDRDLADLKAALNGSSSVSQAKGLFAASAGQRAPAWNSFFARLDGLISQLAAEGKLPSEAYYRGSMQSTAKALEGGP